MGPPLTHELSRSNVRVIVAGDWVARLLLLRVVAGLGFPAMYRLIVAGGVVCGLLPVRMIVAVFPVRVQAAADGLAGVAYPYELVPVENHIFVRLGPNPGSRPEHEAL